MYGENLGKTKKSTQKVVNVLLLYDADHATSLSADIQKKMDRMIEKAGGSLESIGLVQTDLVFCFGCLRCWTSGTGRCVSKDRMEELEQKLPGCDLILILTPVLFGTFSSTMKTILDKGFGNKLTDTAEITIPS
jgi:multimeric flavodoxin WrbA